MATEAGSGNSTLEALRKRMVERAEKDTRQHGESEAEYVERMREQAKRMARGLALKRKLDLNEEIPF